MSTSVRELDLFKAGFKRKVDSLNILATGLQKTCAGRQWPSLESAHDIYVPAVAALRNEHRLLSESYQTYYKNVTADVICSIRALVQNFETNGKKIVSEYTRLGKEFLQYKCVRQPATNLQKAQSILAEFSERLRPLVAQKNELEQTLSAEINRILLRFVDFTETLARQELASVTTIRSALTVPETNIKIGDTNSEIYALCIAISGQTSALQQV